MSSAIYHKHHADGLITAYIHPSAQSKSIKKKMTDEELQKKCKNDLFWNDRKREREEWS